MPDVRTSACYAFVDEEELSSRRACKIEVRQDVAGRAIRVRPRCRLGRWQGASRTIEQGATERYREEGGGDQVGQEMTAEQQPHSSIYPKTPSLWSFLPVGLLIVLGVYVYSVGGAFLEAAVSVAGIYFLGFLIAVAVQHVGLSATQD
jgi:hypothetical protein